MGLVGSYLARQLLADGEEVVLFEPRAEFHQGAANLAGRVEIAGGDVGERVHVLEAVSRYRVSCIYHCAAVLSAPCDASAASGFRTPDAQIAFEWDKGEAMRVANRSLRYKMDTTAASEDFGYTLRYPLEAMVADFIGEVRAERPVTGMQPAQP